MHIRCVAIPADHDVDRQEYGRRPIKSDRLEQQNRRIHQQDDAVSRSDAEPEIGSVRYIEFLDDTEAGILQEPTN